MESLLGQFYNKIKGSQEDIASESLTYILKKSIRARQTINQIVNLNTGLELPDLSYQTQKVGANLEKPDISGTDNNGKEILLIEAKFWASLTVNQPNGYLERLGKNTILIFLVPTLRVRPIFDEVLQRVKEKYSGIETDVENFKIKFNHSNKYILIKSWSEILNVVKSELLQENNKNLVSDIDQIIGFCDTIDDNSFQPIIDIDLSPSIPRKINSYCNIVDKVVYEIKIRNTNASTKGLKSAGHKYGYRRYFSIVNYGFGLDFETQLWAEFADTPFWVSIVENTKDWTNSEEFVNECEKNAFNLKHVFVRRNKEIFFSLSPILNETEDRVISDLVDKIELIYNEIENNVVRKTNRI